jgi:hypothetical protein
MTQPDLLTVCIAAFFAVMILLTVLAGMIQLLSVIFPHREPPPSGKTGGSGESAPEAAVVAAMHVAAAALYPRHAITRIEEIR